jgi:hypothetical protein
MDPISVDLRLALDAFKGDVQKAEAYLKEKLKGAGASTGTGGRAAGGQVGGFNDLNPGLNDVALASNRLAKNARVTEEKANKAAAKAISDKANFMKDMSFLMMPLMQPGSPWGTLFASRQVFSALTKTDIGKSLAGGTLKGAAMMTAGLIAGTMLVGTALKGLAKIIGETIRSIQLASSTYANALVSGGLSLGFTTRRSMLASVMGVSEKEVFYYGRAIMFLNEKLAQSSKTIAYTSPLLTKVNWEWLAMKKNLSSVFSNTAFMLAPMLSRVMARLNSILEQFVKKQEDARTASETAWNAEKEVLQKRKAVLEAEMASGKSTGGGYLGISRTGGSSYLGLRDADPATELAHINAKLKAHEPAPPPMSYMKQLPVSSWEKMGLVIGGGGRANYDAQTAQNTRKIVEKLDGLRNALIPRSGQFTIDTAYANP